MKFEIEKINSGYLLTIVRVFAHPAQNAVERHAFGTLKDLLSYLETRL